MDKCKQCGNEYKSLGQHWRMSSCQYPIFTEIQWDILVGSMMGDGNHEGHGFNLTSKYGSFEMWCEAVEICGEAYKRLTREETIRCIELAKRMNETDSHNQISEQGWKEKVKNE